MMKQSLVYLLAILCTLLFPHGAYAQEPEMQTILADTPTSTIAESQAVSRQLLEGGAEGLEELFTGVLPPGTGDDTKVRFAIQSLSVYVTRPEAEDEQAMYCNALLKSLDRATDSQVKSFHIEQLEYAGRPDDAKQLAPYLKDPAHVHLAARAMLRLDPIYAFGEFPKALKEATTETLPMLIQAVAFTRNPDTVSLVAPYADSDTSETRLAALFALAESGSPDAAAHFPKKMADARTWQGAKELSALMLYTRELARRGHKASAEKLLKPLAERETTATAEHVQCAALGSLVEILGVDAQPYLAKAIKSPSFKVRKATLKLANRLPETTVTNEWIKIAKGLNGDSKAEVLEMLGDRHDKQALDLVKTSTSDENTTVRLAAISALVDLIGPDAVPTLLNRLKKGDEADVERVKQIFSTIRSLTINPQLAKVSESLPKASRIAAFEVLAARGAAGEVKVLLDAAASGDKDIRLAALRAAEGLVRADSLTTLATLLVAADSKALQTAAQKAYVSAARHAKEGGIDPLMQLWNDSGSEERKLILETLARLCGEQARVLITARITDPDEPLRDAAVRLLSDWQEPDAAPALLEIAQKTENETHNALALAGYLRLTSTGSAEEQLAHLTSVLQVAQRPEEKKLAIAAAGNLETTASLEFLAPYLDDTELQVEAAQSIYRITVPQGAEDTALSGSLATEALRKAATHLEDEKFAEGVRKRLEEADANASSEKSEKPDTTE